jgi:tetratricopeptide (TPR) repeat protein
VTEVDRGRLLLDHGQLDRAERVATAALGRDPADAAAWGLLIDVPVERRDYRALVATAPRALAVVPDHLKAQWALGMARNQLEQYDAAEAVLRRCAVQAPDHGTTHVQLALALAGLADHEGARREAEVATTLAPNDATVHGFKGVVLLRLGDLDAAEAAFREALRLDPEESSAHVNLGHIAYRRGKYDVALEHSLTAVRINPRSGPASRNVLAAAKAVFSAPWLLALIVLWLAFVGVGLGRTLWIVVPLVVLRWFYRYGRFLGLPEVARQALLTQRRRDEPWRLHAWRVVGFAGWTLLLAAAAEIVAPGAVPALAGGALLVAGGFGTAGHARVVPLGARGLLEATRREEERRRAGPPGTT